MSLTGREKAELRAEAHHLPAIVHVGKEGVTRTLMQSLDDALRTRELVKVQLGRSVDAKAKELAGDVAGSVGADIIQVIGRTITLYRHNPELKRKSGDAPPWRQ